MARSANRLPAVSVDPRTAPKGIYRAGYAGRVITAAGPERVYPSGVLYYRTEGEYVPAGSLDWVKPATARRFRCLQRVAGFARNH
ncbi:hypothetical protein SMNI109538_06760 [Smaragdicoccus niigatensis]